MNFLNRYTEPVFCLLRLIAGLLFACHGAQKILGWFPDPRHAGGALPPLMQFGGWLELVCGFLIAFGLFTRIAAFLASGMMAVAYFMAHAKGGFFPIVNHGEAAVLYCWIFLFIFFHGPGRWSIDALWSKPASSSASDTR